MASTANAAPAANGAAASFQSSQNAQNPGQANSRSSYSNKGANNTYNKNYDGSRKQSPMEAGARRNQSQKAWTQGTNPLTQNKPYTHQNGTASQQKPASSVRPMASKETNTPDNHSNDRLTYIFASFIGLPATVTIKNGDQFTGIVSSSVLEANETTALLKMVKRVVTDAERSNGADSKSGYLGSAPNHSMLFDFKDIAGFSVDNVTAVEPAKAQNGATSSFRTDTEISGSLGLRERNLQRWEPSADTNVDLSLESAANSTWDQFETNERLFGATTSWDEEMYTTRIDRSDPAYKRKEAEAARIAREIEGSTSNNAHIREERGQAVENDYNEEEKYSGVRRDESTFPPLSSGQANKYTPPARRAPTGQPTVAGAPFDPAIISSQIARPDSSSRKTPVSIPQASDAGKGKAAPPAKLSAEVEQKLAAMKAPSPSATPTAQKPKASVPENASANVETEVRDAFRQFANLEKFKVQAVQERRRQQNSHDRSVKLNELLKFSKNFKLNTPVPKDLVPILAKDPQKQEQIIEKAKRSHDEKVASAAAAAAEATKPTPVSEQKPAARVTSAPQDHSAHSAPAPMDNRQNFTRGRGGFHPGGPGQMRGSGMHSGGRGTGHLGNRLADLQQQRKAGYGVPQIQPIPHENNLASPPKGAAVPTPTSAVSTKFNVKALEFKPNPAASTFTPTPAAAPSPAQAPALAPTPAVAPAPNPVTQASSPPSTAAPTRSVSRAPSPSMIFGNRKPIPASERPSIKNAFDSVNRLKQEHQHAEYDYSVNGGIPQPYRTPPTWDFPPENEEKSFKDVYAESAAKATAPTVSPQHRQGSSQHMPHQHQLPLHLQQGAPNHPAMSQSHQGQHHLHPQQHHGGQPHFDDHRMHGSSQVFPSPRLQQNHMAYGSPMGPHAQLAYGPGVPGFYAGQGGPQPGHMRPYPGGPPFVAPQGGPMGAPMMVPQHSSGPYMGMPPGAPYNPQMPMYSPNPSHAYPQAPPQPHSGYPSPSRAAPAMMHQGSQQGHHPQQMMYMNPGQHQSNVYNQGGHVPQMRGGGYQQQPHYGSSPHQSHHYAPQPHRQPSNGYNQMPPQMQPGNMPPQQAPANGGAPPTAEGEEAK